MAVWGDNASSAVTCFCVKLIRHCHQMVSATAVGNSDSDKGHLTSIHHRQNISRSTCTADRDRVSVIRHLVIITSI